MIPSQADIRTAQAIGTGHQFDAIEERLLDIQKKIDMQKKNKTTINHDVNKQSGQSNVWDWTESYQQWSKWEDMDELEAKKKFEENRLQSLIDKQNVMQHYHDHSKEKEFFDLPEEVKIKKCDDYRVLGNFLFDQGLFAKAAERYQIAIAYYEYCFPEDPKVQQELDSTRYACLCNIALCYIRIGHYRKAIESANNVLRECKDNHAKALYRRAQAYRHLDEYENSTTDLQAALRLCPGDSAILEELRVVQYLNDKYKNQQTNFAQSMLKEQQSGTAKPQPEKRKPRRKFSIENSAIPLEPIFPKELQAIHEHLTGLTALDPNANKFIS